MGDNDQRAAGEVRGGAPWLGTKEASDRLGITLRTLYRFIDEGALPAYKFGRVVRVKEADLEAFIESSRIEPGSLRHLYPRAADSTAPTADSST